MKMKREESDPAKNKAIKDDDRRKWGTVNVPIQTTLDQGKLNTVLENEYTWVNKKRYSCD